jgi:hypothetical protein
MTILGHPLGLPSVNQVVDPTLHLSSSPPRCEYYGPSLTSNIMGGAPGLGALGQMTNDVQLDPPGYVPPPPEPPKFFARVTRANIRIWLGVGLLPPALLLALGNALGWAVRGFSRTA